MFKVHRNEFYALQKTHTITSHKSKNGLGKTINFWLTKVFSEILSVINFS